VDPHDREETTDFKSVEYQLRPTESLMIFLRAKRAGGIFPDV
jgi:hypothetical protein